MDKKSSTLGLHSGLPSYVSEEADREQLRHMPKASAPCLATQAVQRSKSTQANATPTHPDIEPDAGKTPL